MRESIRAVRGFASVCLLVFTKFFGRQTSFLTTRTSPAPAATQRPPSSSFPSKRSVSVYPPTLLYSLKPVLRAHFLRSPRLVRHPKKKPRPFPPLGPIPPPPPFPTVPVAPLRDPVERAPSRGSTSVSVLLTRRALGPGSSSRVGDARPSSPSSAVPLSSDTVPLPSVAAAGKAPARPTGPLHAPSASAKPSTPADASVGQKIDAPAPPPLPSTSKRPTRSARSQAPKEESVEEAPPTKTRKTRTAKHPPYELQKRSSSAFSRSGPLALPRFPPLFAVQALRLHSTPAQVNSLREEQEIQVRFSPLHPYIFLKI